MLVLFIRVKKKNLQSTTSRQLAVLMDQLSILTNEICVCLCYLLKELFEI